MNWQKVFLIIAVLVIAIIVWLGRYEIIGVPAGGQGATGTAYRLDRWTGQVNYIQFENTGVVKFK